MCGIYGFAGGPVDIERVRRIALQIEEKRGGHAFGFAWIAGGRLRMYKQAGRLALCPSALDMVKGATMLIGHLRYATVGDTSDNSNNHPHACDGGWLAHNGTLRGNVLQAGRTLPSIGDCDSELIARFVEVSPKRTFSDRIAHGLEFASSDGSEHALLGLWRSPSVIIAATSGKPLHFSTTDKGETYLASLPDRLPGNVKRLDTGKILTVKHVR